jgi:hypothetical protein
MKRVRSILIALVLVAPVSRLDAAGFAISDNFTVFTPTWPSHQQAQAYAEQVLRNAEAWRGDIARDWLGEELPPSVGQTTINVSFTEERDAGLTWIKDDPRRRYHTIYLSTTPDRALGSTLAHELVHVVLATRYPPPNRLPAWIEEGIAGTYDDDDRQTVRRRSIAWFARTGNWPEIETVMNSQSIAATQKELYAVASSLVEFLLTRGDRSTLLEFGQYANTAGWDAALSRYYQIASVPELQAEWRRWIERSGHRPT